MNKRSTVAILGVLFFLVNQTSVFSDQWRLPEKKKYYSPNKKYFIEIMPRKIESALKYFEDKEKGIEPAGSPKGEKLSYCKGILYKVVSEEKKKKIWEKRLRNDVSPAYALVSDNGKYVVTFDNWHMAGYGDNVVVIYGESGNVVRSLGLSEIFPKDSKVRLPRSVSSILWGDPEGHHIDVKKSLLILKLIDNWTGSFEDGVQYKKIEINLITGKRNIKK